MSRRRIRAIAGWLVTSIGLLAAIGVFAVILTLTGGSTGRTGSGSTPAASLVPSSSPWLVSIAPGQIGMPDGADCNACHVTENGVVGVRSIPRIAHPVHGWSECTNCHDNERLVATAPGHTGIHADQCLVCHRESSQPAPTPRHPTLPDSDCLACHGSLAPLPSDMVDRPRTLCWLCHHS